MQFLVIKTVSHLCACRSTRYGHAKFPVFILRAVTIELPYHHEFYRSKLGLKASNHPYHEATNIMQALLVTPEINVCSAPQG